MSCISWVWGRTWSGKPVVSSQVSPRIVQVVEITKSAGLKWKSLSESEKSRTPAAAQRSAGSGGGGGGGLMRPERRRSRADGRWHR